MSLLINVSSHIVAAGAEKTDTATSAEAGSEKSDSWGNWKLDSLQGGSSSAWSFPWGEEAEQKKEEEEVSIVQNKTAEEIRTEVLKAAKERSKAKAKSNQDKTKIEGLETGLLDSANDSNEYLSKSGVDISQTDTDATILSDNKQPASEGEVESNAKLRTESAQHVIGESDIVTELQDSGPVMKEYSEISEDITKPDFDDTQVQTLEVKEYEGSMKVISSTEDFTSVSLSAIDSEMSLVDPQDEKNDKFDQDHFSNEVVTDASSSEIVEHEAVEVVSNASAIQEDFTVQTEENVSEKHDVESLGLFDVNDDISSSDQDILEYDKISSDEDMVKVSQSDTTEITSDNLHEKVNDEVNLSTLDESEIVNVSAQEENEVETMREMSEEPSGDKSIEVNTDVIVEPDLDEKPVLETFANLVQMRNSDSELSMNKLDSSVDTGTSEETVIDQFVNTDGSEITDTEDVFMSNPGDTALDSSFPDDNLNEPCDMFDDSRNLDDKADVSPAHSFVKYMLDEVLDEGKHDDSSECHSAEKSDGSRSINSNHESGDEIDTTTSSDIEIISLPTPNGENKMVSLQNVLITLTMSAYHISKKGFRCLLITSAVYLYDHKLNI